MVSLKFHDVCHKWTNRSIEVKISVDEEDENCKSLCLKINYGLDGNYEFINLDKSTAIKLSKELRKQIALLD